MNLTRLLSFWKHALALMALVTIVGLSACDDGDDGPSVYNGTIIQLIQDTEYHQTDANSIDQGDKSLDSLVKYINLYPDLVGLLGSTTQYTLFAPSNNAFKSLLATLGATDVRLINPDLIKGVLSYHIASGELLQSSITSGTLITTLYTGTVNNPNDKIEVNADGTLKTGSSNQNIILQFPDRRATNGVVHITASVLIPQSVGAALTPILGTMAQDVLLGKDFSNLAKVIQAADAIFTENQSTGALKITTWLAMPISSTGANQKGFTFFAPVNKAGTTDVFSDAVATALLAMPDKGRSVILNHLVISGQYTVGNVPSPNPNGITKFTSPGGVIVPQTGANKTITYSVTTPSTSVPTGVVLSNTPSNQATFRPIVVGDLARSNGTIQVFAGVLQ